MARLAVAAEALIRPQLLVLISELPAPDWFDANGKATKPVAVKQVTSQVQSQKQPMWLFRFKQALYLDV